MFWLEASRPGLWFQTVWLYLVPTSGRPEVFADWRFWVGLVFVTLPLNLLVYGWNDIVDYEIDQINPRKGGYLFGARGSRAQLRRLPLTIALVNVPAAVALVVAAGARALVVLAGIVAVNALYNLPRRGLRGRPPFELINQLGYLLILPLSAMVNRVPDLPAGSLFYLVLFCTHAHLMGEVMDVVPDRRAGRRTTATWLGVMPVKLIVLSLVAAEGGFLVWVFDERVLGGFLFAGALWLALDAFWLFRSRGYSRAQFRLFGLALNAAGCTSIAWVWWRGSLS